MCGIVGAIGNILPAGEKAVHQMLIFDTVRGEHSTGLLCVKKFDEEEFILAKQVGNAFELFETQKYKSIMSSSSRILLGHNRHATQGKVNKANAHPFEFDSLVGVHNGSLTNKIAMHEGNIWDVDSQAMYAHIEAKGIEDALRTARGAFALAWWDKADNTMNFVRNKERPLYYALTTDNSPTMFFASEPWMIDVATGRNSIKIHDIESFEVGLLYKVPVGKGGVLGKPVIRPVEFAPPPITTTYSYSSNSRGSTPSNVSVSNNNGVVTVKEGTTNSSLVHGTTNSGTAENVVPINKKSVLNGDFLNKKNVLFEAVCTQRDSHGAEYVVCFAPSHPYLESRLYFNQQAKRIFENIGCEFEGDVSSFINVEGQRGFYKVTPHSVRILTYPSLSEDNTLDLTALYPDHKGNDVNLEAWQKKYGTCAFCSSNLTPDQLDIGARFTAEGEILCADCCEDSELKKYVTLI